MKVLVIGAAGKTGGAVVEQAIAAGHQVTAFVQKSDDYESSVARVVEGDATDRADIEKAVLGQDAVIDTIGGNAPWKTTTLEENAASNIIVSMQKNSVRRLIVVSMIGEGDSGTNIPIYERLLLPTLLRGTQKDKAAMESAVQSSGLDWVILRPTFLNDGSATGNVRVFEAQTGEKAHGITRADLACFIVAQISGDDYLRQAVTVANH